MKTIIDVIAVTDQIAMTKQQQKINQWRTTGLFVDMQVVATSEYVVFTITRHKEAPNTNPFNEPLHHASDDLATLTNDMKNDMVDDPAKDDVPF